MRVHALDIPEDPAHLAFWLERHLVGLDLARLVAELSAVHGTSSEPPPPVRDVLGERIETVLAEGLRGLPPEVLRRLLRQPKLLLELQELVLTDGGAYWDRVAPSSGDLGEAVARGRQRLEVYLAATEPGVRQRRDSPGTIVLAWYRRPWVVSLATAAAVLLAAFLYQHLGTRPPSETLAAWGWSKPGALPDNVPADVYLHRLADAATEWFRERPEEPAALARRINEFRQGCSTLLFAEHRPLAPADRQWLRERCRAWAGELDRDLAALEAGRDPLQVRAEVDELVNRLTESLRARGTQPAAA